MPTMVRHTAPCMEAQPPDLSCCWVPAPPSIMTWSDMLAETSQGTWAVAADGAAEARLIEIGPSSSDKAATNATTTAIDDCRRREGSDGVAVLWVMMETGSTSRPKIKRN